MTFFCIFFKEYPNHGQTLGIDRPSYDSHVEPSFAALVSDPDVRPPPETSPDRGPIAPENHD